MSYVEQRRLGNLSGADILYGLRFYATRGQRGFSQGDYDAIICNVNGSSLILKASSRIELSRMWQPLSTASTAGIWIYSTLEQGSSTFLT